MTGRIPQEWHPERRGTVAVASSGKSLGDRAKGSGLGWYCQPQAKASARQVSIKREAKARGMALSSKWGDGLCRFTGAGRAEASA